MWPLSTSYAFFGFSIVAEAYRDGYLGWKNTVKHMQDTSRLARAQVDNSATAHARRDAKSSKFLTNTTQKFVVDGAAIPDVKFDAGESYAGQLPVGGDSDGKLWFWFWPTTAPDEPKEILIWLNGGPGCSSLVGLFQENGPILWQTGTDAPVSNPWSWHRLTNVIWVDQPIGTGFSTGNVTANNEDDVSRQFMGFWKNFIDTFQMHSYKVYLTGESYAGAYCPYIASNMLHAGNSSYFNVAGLHIYDPVIAERPIHTQIVTKQFVDYWAPIFPFSDTVKAQLANMSKSCGYDDYVYKYLTFPANGAQPVTIPGIGDGGVDAEESCDIWRTVRDAVSELNPAFNVYQVAQLPPFLDDVLDSGRISPDKKVYFNRSDVKKAINAPGIPWSICAMIPVLLVDRSPPSSKTALPHVIERTGNVMISHGTHDFILVPAGTLLAIQNMTWGGKIGFAALPADPLFVPNHPAVDPATLSAQGVVGTTHTERGLTWSLINMAGHMVPIWQAAAAFRQTEFLLGRVDSLSSTQPLSIYANASQPDPASLGKGTGPAWGRWLNDTSPGTGCA